MTPMLTIIGNVVTSISGGNRVQQSMVSLVIMYNTALAQFELLDHENDARQSLSTLADMMQQCNAVEYLLGCQPLHGMNASSIETTPNGSSSPSTTNTRHDAESDRSSRKRRRSSSFDTEENSMHDREAVLETPAPCSISPSPEREPHSMSTDNPSNIKGSLEPVLRLLVSRCRTVLSAIELRLRTCTDPLSFGDPLGHSTTIPYCRFCEIVSDACILAMAICISIQQLVAAKAIATSCSILCTVGDASGSFRVRTDDGSVHNLVRNDARWQYLQATIHMLEGDLGSAQANLASIEAYINRQANVLRPVNVWPAVYLLGMHLQLHDPRVLVIVLTSSSVHGLAWLYWEQGNAIKAQQYFSECTIVDRYRTSDSLCMLAHCNAQQVRR